jgi:transposase
MTSQRLTYTTDLTDAEGQLLAPLLPPEKAGGRPRKYPRREVLNGLP